MAVVLRMARYGTKKRPFYRVVATDRANKRDGRFIEVVGTVDPLPKTGTEAKFNWARIDHWLSVGAQPSETVAALMKKFPREYIAAPKAAKSVPAPKPRPVKAPKPAPAAEATEAAAETVEAAPAEAAAPAAE